MLPIVYYSSGRVETQSKRATGTGKRDRRTRNCAFPPPANEYKRQNRLDGDEITPRPRVDLIAGAATCFEVTRRQLTCVSIQHWGWTTAFGTRWPPAYTADDGFAVLSKYWWPWHILVQILRTELAIFPGGNGLSRVVRRLESRVRKVTTLPLKITRLIQPTWCVHGRARETSVRREKLRKLRTHTRPGMPPMISTWARERTS